MFIIKCGMVWVRVGCVEWGDVGMGWHGVGRGGVECVMSVWSVSGGVGCLVLVPQDMWGQLYGVGYFLQP